MASRRKTTRNLLLGLLFISPNIAGFLVFTLVPLVLSLMLAFSNWDLRLHNMFKAEPIRFVGLENFRRLLSNPDLLKYFGNTLFLMMGIPLTLAANLALAVMLSKDLKGAARRQVRLGLIVGALLVVSCVMLTVIGSGATAMTILLAGAAGGILLAGVTVGSTIYRTVYYIPHFVSGVAVFILWKNLFSPSPVGPINNFLAGPLESFSGAVRAAPPGIFQAGMWLCVAVAALLLMWGLRWMRKQWMDGDVGWSAAIVPLGMLMLPTVMGQSWLPGVWSARILAAVGGLWILKQLFHCRHGKTFPCHRSEGFGSASMLAMGLMVAQFILVGLALVLHELPAMVAQAGPAGLKPPNWLNSYGWAKPAMMFMGFCLGIGSNNMLLYLAGLTNIPPELYEAADVEGASGVQKFWNITWPQLAPTTFFIIIMSVMGGLQGGFEQARTMTNGGPAGATTTLSYFIYTEGFETGRLGYSAAVAWALFAMVFLVTLFNRRFGNRYVND